MGEAQKIHIRKPVERVKAPHFLETFKEKLEDFISELHYQTWHLFSLPTSRGEAGEKIFLPPAAIIH